MPGPQPSPATISTSSAAGQPGGELQRAEAGGASGAAILGLAATEVQQPQGAADPGSLEPRPPVLQQEGPGAQANPAPPPPHEQPAAGPELAVTRPLPPQERGGQAQEAGSTSSAPQTEAPLQPVASGSAWREAPPPPSDCSSSGAPGAAAAGTASGQAGAAAASAPAAPDGGALSFKLQFPGSQPRRGAGVRRAPAAAPSAAIAIRSSRAPVMSVGSAALVQLAQRNSGGGAGGAPREVPGPPHPLDSGRGDGGHFGAAAGQPHGDGQRAVVHEAWSSGSGGAALARPSYIEAAPQGGEGPRREAAAHAPAAVQVTSARRRCRAEAAGRPRRAGGLRRPLGRWGVGLWAALAERAASAAGRACGSLAAVAWGVGTPPPFLGHHDSGKSAAPRGLWGC